MWDFDKAIAEWHKSNEHSKVAHGGDRILKDCDECMRLAENIFIAGGITLEVAAEMTELKALSGIARHLLKRKGIDPDNREDAWELG